MDFGLTTNQAKVYLSVIQSGLTSVGKIAEATALHRQDIYKILPKLEKMGLTMTTLEEPIRVEAIAVDKALNRLVLAEKKKAKQRITRLEASLKELITAIREQQQNKETEEEKARFSLLKTDKQIMNASDLIFESTKNDCCLVTNLELIARRRLHFREHFQKLSKRGVRIRVIVENINNEDLVKKAVEEMRPNNGDFAAKLIHKSEGAPYRISDNKELFIRRKEVTESGLPTVLWTNSKNMVQICKENFDKAWKSRRAIRIYPPRTSQKKRETK